MKMKLLLLALLLILTVTSSKAQFLYGTANKDEHLVSTVLTPDGGQIFLANSGKDTSQDILIYRTSNTGKILWQKRYGQGNNYRDIAVKLISTNDGNYVFAGSTRVAWPNKPHFSRRASFLNKIDINGINKWGLPTFIYDTSANILAVADSLVLPTNIDYEINDFKGELIHSICEIPNGQIACVGTFNWGATIANGFFMIIDSSGTEQINNRLGLSSATSIYYGSHYATEYFGVNYDSTTGCIIASGLIKEYSTTYNSFTYIPMISCFKSGGSIDWCKTYNYTVFNLLGAAMYLHWALQADVLNGKIYYTIANTDDYLWKKSAIYNILEVDEMTGNILSNKYVRLGTASNSFYNYGVHITKPIPNNVDSSLTDLLILHTPAKNYTDYNDTTSKKVHFFRISNYPTNTTASLGFGKQYIRFGNQKIATLTPNNRSNYIYVGCDFQNDSAQLFKKQFDNGILQLNITTGMANVNNCFNDSISSIQLLNIVNTTVTSFYDYEINLTDIYPLAKTESIVVDTPTILVQKIYCAPCINNANITIQVMSIPTCDSSNLPLILKATTTKPQINFVWTENNNIVGVIQSSTATSQTIKINNPVIGTHQYFVSSEDSSCPTKDTASIIVTIKPSKPAPPNLYTNTLNYCIGSGVPRSLSSLVVPNSIGVGNSLVWYVGNATTGSATMPTYSTTVAGTYTFYVAQQTTSGCLSNKVLITVNVTAAPKLTLTPIATIKHCADTTITLQLHTNVPNKDIIWEVAGVGTQSNDSSYTLTITTDTSFSYTVTVINNATNCSSTKTAWVTVQSCYTPCNFDGATDLSNALTQSPTLSNGKYTIANNLTAPTGLSTITNSQIIVADNKKITVPNGATLVLQGCHLYSCAAMWQGITVQQGGTLIIDSSTNGNSSFIEDADTAIQVAIGEGTELYYNGRPYPYIIAANATIFNRNNVGIYLYNNNGGQTTLPNNYVQIGNCIFTSRDIPFGTTGGGSWVKHSTLLQSPTLNRCDITVPALTSPYINNALYSPTNIAAYLKQTNKAKPTVGIAINGQQFKTGSLTIGNGTAFDNQCNTTLFDNLGMGIRSLGTLSGGVGNGTAFNLRNCTFANGITTGLTKQGSAQPGLGVYAIYAGNAAIDISSPVGSKDNAFYNMSYAVKNMYGSKLNVSNCYIASHQSLANLNNAAITTGNWGIYSQSREYDTINISNNQIVNIKEAIKVDVSGVNSTTKITNSLNINNNTIQDYFAATGCPTCYVKNAITLAGNTAVSNKTLAASCSNNLLTRVFYGINASSFKSKNVEIMQNNISLQQYTNNGIVQEQYGITCNGGVAVVNLLDFYTNKVTDNVIIGSFDNATNSRANQTGVLLTAPQNNTEVSCNTVDRLTHGFRFFGPQLNTTKFWNNTMNYTNKYGFTLDKGGVIGTQGSSKRGVVCTSDNQWVGANTDWTNAAHYKTLCANGSNAASSPIWVQQYSNIYNPDGIGLNGWLGTSMPYSATAIGTIPASIVYKIPVGICMRCNTSQGDYPYAVSEGVDIATLEEIALQDPDVATTTEEEDAITAAKQQLYYFLKCNPNLKEYSSILTDFMVDNQYATMDYVSLMEWALNVNRYTLAAALLDTWTTETTPDANNKVYYTWLYNMQMREEYKPDIAEVLSLAKQCPLTGGSIVYAARNLYNSLAEDNLNFENACEDVKPMARGVNVKGGSGQRLTVSGISVYPNPTKGYVFITLPTTEKACWQITATDVIGNVVTEKRVKQSVSKTFVELKGNTGIYFVKILNCTTGTLEVKKVILQ